MNKKESHLDASRLENIYNLPGWRRILKLENILLAVLYYNLLPQFFNCIYCIQVFFSLVRHAMRVIIKKINYMSTQIIMVMV